MALFYLFSGRSQLFFSIRISHSQISLHFATATYIKALLPSLHIFQHAQWVIMRKAASDNSFFNFNCRSYALTFVRFVLPTNLKLALLFEKRFPV